MVGFEIMIKVEPGKRVEFLQAFEMVKEIGQLNDKRRDMELFEGVQNLNTLLWIEHWENEKYLASYFCNNNFISMIGAIEVLGQLIYKRTFTVNEERNE